MDKLPHPTIFRDADGSYKLWNHGDQVWEINDIDLFVERLNWMANARG